MKSIESNFIENEIEYSPLSRKEGFSIHHDWLELFAWKVKEQTGKYTINGYVWEAYWSRLISSLTGDDGMNEYQSKNSEDYYVIYENGETVFDCSGTTWPNLFRLEAIVFPKSKMWSMVFSHEETVHYVEPET